MEDQGGFARPIRSDQGNFLAWFDFQARRRCNATRSIRVSVTQIFDFNLNDAWLIPKSGMQIPVKGQAGSSW